MNDHIPDATKMMSDTPRMQSALLDHPDAGFAKIWQVGCEIERELNAANAIIRQQQLLDEENLRLQDRIKRLEEALDCLTLVVGLTPIAGNKDALQEAFDLARAALKAKEAKP
jgi:hypothetical protein